MAKYSYEFELKVVQAYLQCEGGYGYLAKKFDRENPDKYAQHLGYIKIERSSHKTTTLIKSLTFWGHITPQF